MILLLVHLERKGLLVAIKVLDDAKLIYDGDFNMTRIHQLEQPDKTANLRVDPLLLLLLYIIFSHITLKRNTSEMRLQLLANPGHAENNQIALCSPR